MFLVNLLFTTKIPKKKLFKFGNFRKEINGKFYVGTNLSFISFLFCKLGVFFQYLSQNETMIENFVFFSTGKV